MSRKVKAIQIKEHTLPPTYIYQVIDENTKRKLLDLKKELEAEAENPQN